MTQASESVTRAEMVRLLVIERAKNIGYRSLDTEQRQRFDIEIIGGAVDATNGDLLLAEVIAMESLRIADSAEAAASRAALAGNGSEPTTVPGVSYADASRSVELTAATVDAVRSGHLAALVTTWDEAAALTGATLSEPTTADTIGHEFGLAAGDSLGLARQISGAVTAARRTHAVGTALS